MNDERSVVVVVVVNVKGHNSSQFKWYLTLELFDFFPFARRDSVTGSVLCSPSSCSSSSSSTSRCCSICTPFKSLSVSRLKHLKKEEI